MFDFGLFSFERVVLVSIWRSAKHRNAPNRVSNSQMLPRQWLSLKYVLLSMWYWEELKFSVRCVIQTYHDKIVSMSIVHLTWLVGQTLIKQFVRQVIIFVCLFVLLWFFTSEFGNKIEIRCCSSWLLWRRCRWNWKLFASHEKHTITIVVNIL